jgi:hypothetical protein
MRWWLVLEEFRDADRAVGSVGCNAATGNAEFTQVKAIGHRTDGVQESADVIEVSTGLFETLFEVTREVGNEVLRRRGDFTGDFFGADESLFGT